MRNLLVTLPDRLKVAWRALCSRWYAAILRWIDGYLRRHDQERAYTLLDFEELPVLYDEADIPILFDEAGGFAQNSWPETPVPIDYGDSGVLS
jgi:hypothetical protein